MRVLLSNDDGLRAEGLEALVRAVEGLGELWIVAPEHEQSASSHSLSLHRPLRIREAAPRVYGVDGTPADCVYVAVNHLMLDERPALVLSGINHGPNLAADVIYSGTVAAAMEGSLLGIPSIAFSLAARPARDFSFAARFAGAFVRAALERELPRGMLLNVNVPATGQHPVGGAERELLSRFEITRLGRHAYAADVIEKVDPRGRKYFWIGGSEYAHVSEAGTDVTAVYDAGLVSVTPLMLDLTQPGLIPALREWSVQGFDQARSSAGG